MYISVLLPLALKEPLMYGVPEDMEPSVVVGARVAVELGLRKVYSAIVLDVVEEEPNVKRPFVLKNILGVLEDFAVVTPNQLKLWRWIASYYMCTEGEVMRSFFPASMKLATFKEASESSYSFSRSYGMRLVRRLSLSAELSADNLAACNAVLDKLKRSKAQFLALTIFLNELFSNPQVSAITQSVLLSNGASVAALKGLCKKGYLVSTDTLEPLLYSQPRVTSHIGDLPQLTAAQQKSYQSISDAFDRGVPALLYGVAGSGKTEIYMHHIKRVIEQGGKVLLLIPEMALTTQLVSRLEKYFAGELTLYNSRTSPAGRHTIYNKVLHGASGSLIVGSRSVVALAHHRLDLVIIDEEQEPSYKQQESAPRYSARDCAIMVAHFFGASTLLVSATPSIESFYNAERGKYALVTLKERFNGLSNPKVMIIDRRSIASKERKERGFSPDTRYISTYLLKRIQEVISVGGQVILFQNRRGYSSFLECGNCGYTPSCPSCNVTLTYHKYRSEMVCHYCSHTIAAPKSCPKCGSLNMLSRGIGTENIEEKVSELLPKARIVRIDADVMRTPKQLKSALDAIANREADIIIGTQMISKGFDFDNIELVGVINADNLLCFPDYRSTERTYQLLTQIAGRMSRGLKRGELVIQTSRSIDTLMGNVINFSYEKMYEEELLERKKFFYPPFCKMVELTLRHRDQAILHQAATFLAAECHKVFGGRVSGPAPALIERVRDFYIETITIRVETTRSFDKARLHLQNLLTEAVKNPLLKGLIITPMVYN